MSNLLRNFTVAAAASATMLTGGMMTAPAAQAQDFGTIFKRQAEGAVNDWAHDQRREMRQRRYEEQRYRQQMRNYNRTLQNYEYMRQTLPCPNGARERVNGNVNSWNGGAPTMNGNISCENNTGQYSQPSQYGYNSGGSYALGNRAAELRARRGYRR